MITSPCRPDAKGKCSAAKRPGIRCRKKCIILLQFRVGSIGRIDILQAVDCDGADYSLSEE